jgi:hypothetical protein
VNVRRFGRSDTSGSAAAGGLTALSGITTRSFSYALKSKLPGGTVSCSLAQRDMLKKLGVPTPKQVLAVTDPVPAAADA